MKLLKFWLFEWLDHGYLVWALKVHCETVTDGADTLDPWKFKISYDKLVIASGAQASTFGIHGVKEHASFLREVHHAQAIRRKLLLNLMLSDVPGKVPLGCFTYYSGNK